MIVTTIDPITGTKVTDLEHHPYVVEGSGMAATKIYFESEDTKCTYVLEHPDDPSLFKDNDTQFPS